MPSPPMQHCLKQVRGGRLQHIQHLFKPLRPAVIRVRHFRRDCRVSNFGGRQGMRYGKYGAPNITRLALGL